MEVMRDELSWRVEYQVVSEKKALKFLFDAIGHTYGTIERYSGPETILYSARKWEATSRQERAKKMTIISDSAGWRIYPSTDEEDAALEYLFEALNLCHGNGSKVCTMIYPLATSSP